MTAPVMSLFACADSKEFAITSTANFTKYPELIPYTKEYIDAYSAAPQLVRMYLDGYSATFMSFSSNLIGTVFADFIKLVGKLRLIDEPFAGTGKPAITHAKPNAKNYADGANDPEYIAALELYLADKKLAVEYDQAGKLHEYGFYIDAIKKYKDIIPEAKTACEVALALYDSYLEFDKNGTTEKAQAGMKAYDAMTSEYDKAFYKKLGSVYAYYLIYLNSKKDDYAYSNLSFGQLYAKREETAGMALIAEFEERLKTLDLNTVNNEIVAEAEAKYKAIPTTLLSKLSDEAAAKYKEVLACYSPDQPLTPSDYRYEKEIAEFSAAKGLTSLPIINGATDVLVAIENRIATFIYHKAVGTLMTNANVSIAGSLYKYIADADIEASGINVSQVLSTMLKPSNLASLLIEDISMQAQRRSSLKPPRPTTASTPMQISPLSRAIGASPTATPRDSQTRSQLRSAR